MTTTFLNTKIGEVKNKKTGTSSLVKKIDYSDKLSEIESNYFATSDYNKFTKYLKPNTWYKTKAKMITR